MPQGLKRYQQTNQLHFFTFSRHHCLPLLATPHANAVVERHLERLRQTHIFDLHGYVLMPEHVHLLLSEPTRHPLGTTLKVLKQETAKHLIGTHPHFWLPRYFDFNVRTEAKRIEKLKYIHRNPVKRGLSPAPRGIPLVKRRPLRHRPPLHHPPHLPLDHPPSSPAAPKAGCPTPSTHRLAQCRAPSPILKPPQVVPSRRASHRLPPGPPAPRSEVPI